jgi:His-Xaa-Ser system protein HxsD
MSWPGLEIDALGDLGTVTIDPSVYSEQAIFRATYWLTDRHYIFLDREGERIRVELRAKAGSTSDLQEACAELCNALIDFRLRDIVAKETGAIREALVKQAFLQGVPQPSLPGARSNDKHLAEASE